MRKTKHQTNFRTPNYKHEDLTPKIMAKSPLAFRQRKFIGQSSAVPTNRLQVKETSIFKSRKPNLQFEPSPKQHQKLTNEQILNSSVYKMMQEQIQEMIRRQISQFQKLDELKEIKDKEIKQVKQEQRSIKLQIWQLRNQTMELKEAIEIEHEQNLKLMEELEITEEEFEMYFKEHQESQQKQNDILQNDQQYELCQNEQQ